MIVPHPDLTRRIEGVIAESNREHIETLQRLDPSRGAEARPVSGGWATHDGVGSFNCMVVGWGLEGPVPPEEMDEVIGWFDGRPGVMRVGFAEAADKTSIAALEERGFRLRGMAVNAGLPLADTGPEGGGAADGEVQVVLAEAALREAWVETNLHAFSEQDEGEVDEGIAWLIRGLFDRPSLTPFLALVEGEPAGAGAVELHGDLAYCTGAATLPRHRRRGVHRALLEARTAFAARAGAELLLVNAIAGSPSLRNLVRNGFQPLSNHVWLTREPIPEEEL